METAPLAPGTQPPRRKATGSSDGWLGSVVLGVFLFCVYLSNGRELGTDDTFSASVLPLNILRGGGVYLEHQRPKNAGVDDRLPYVWVRSRGHVVMLYPIGPALVILPLVAPQVAVLDRWRPGWDRDYLECVTNCFSMVKRAMAVIVSLAGVILYRILLRLRLRRVALTAVVAAFLGSDLWVVGSQAAWQHGPAALALVATIALLQPQPVSRLRLGLAGLTTTIVVACRLMDVVFALAIVLWLGWTNRRALYWFLPMPALGATALLGYNLWFFGTVLGGQDRLEQLHTTFHGVTGIWTGNLAQGALGTLLSPNRGLIVFSPWIALAIACLAVPAVSRRVASHSLLCVLFVSLVPYLFMLSKYSVWWGGHCFGPRYWTDSIPLFAILFAFGLDWMLTRCRPLMAVAAVTIGLSVTIQMIGAFCYPSTWNASPANVDLHHERLWDWKDTELSRCFEEGLKPRGR